MGSHHARHLREMGADLEVVDPALGLPEPAGLPDAAVIAVPSHLHLAVALPLLRQGVPCLIEKPLAADLSEGAQLARYPRLMVGHVERYNPALSLLSGPLRFVQAERLAPYSGRAADVDVVLDLMIHDIDIFLASDPQDPLGGVQAEGLAVTSGQVDIAQARLETVGGRVATLSASRVSRTASRRLRAFVAGEYWSLDLREHRAHRVRWGESLEEQAVEVPRWDALRRELEDFLAAVTEDQPMPIPGEAGMDALRAAWLIQDAIFRRGHPKRIVPG